MKWLNSFSLKLFEKKELLYSYDLIILSFEK